MEPGDCFKRSACCGCLRNSNFITQTKILPKYIFEVIEMLLVVMGGHLQRGGACIVFTIGKSGIIVIPGKWLFISPWVPVPKVSVTDGTMWLWRGLVLPSLEFNIRIRELNLIWE